MSECTQDRADMLEHADEVAKYIALHSTLTAEQAYNILMDHVNFMVENYEPEEERES